MAFKIFIVSFVLVALFMLTFGVEWLTHVDMMKTSTSRYGRASFRRFKEEFDKVDWKYNSMFRKSLFSGDYMTNNRTQFHASIIEFNGKGMMMRDPISFALAKRYANKYIKENFNQKVKW